jgi:hypothetical protein
MVNVSAISARGTVLSRQCYGGCRHTFTGNAYETSGENITVKPLEVRCTYCGGRMVELAYVRSGFAPLILR